MFLYHKQVVLLLLRFFYSDDKVRALDMAELASIMQISSALLPFLGRKEVTFLGKNVFGLIIGLLVNNLAILFHFFYHSGPMHQCLRVGAYMLQLQ